MTCHHEALHLHNSARFTFWKILQPSPKTARCALSCLKSWQKPYKFPWCPPPDKCDENVLRVAERMYWTNLFGLFVGLGWSPQRRLLRIFLFMPRGAAAPAPPLLRARLFTWPPATGFPIYFVAAFTYGVCWWRGAAEAEPTAP